MRIPGTQRILGLIGACMVAAVFGILFNVSIQAKEAPEIVIQKGHSGYIYSVAISKDGKYIASGSFDKTVRLWDVRTGKEIRTFSGHISSVYSVAFSRNGQTLASGSHDKTVRLWDVKTGKEIHTFTGHTDQVKSVAISRDGQTLVSGSNDKTVRLWELKTGNEIRNFKGHTDSVYSVAISEDGLILISGSWDNTVRLWDVKTGKEIRTFKGHKDDVLSVSFSVNSQIIASGGSDNTVRLWNIKTGKEIRNFTGHTAEVKSVILSKDGQTLVSGGNDKTVRLWDVKTGAEIRTFLGHTNDINSVTISEDDQMLVSGSWDQTVRLWDVKTGKEIHTFSGYTNQVLSVALSGDRKTLVSGSHDKTVRLWDVKTGRKIRTFIGHTAFVTAVALSKDGQTLASGSWDETVRLWDANNSKKTRIFIGHTGGVSCLALSEDGQILVSGSADKTMNLWDVKIGQEIRTLAGHTGWINCVNLSGDGQILVSGSADNTVRLWDIKTCKEIHTFFGHKWGVTTVALNWDGQAMVSGDGNNTFRLWDVKTGKELRTFSGYTSDITSMALNRNGQTMVSGGADNIVRLWDVSTGHEIRSFNGHTSDITSVVLSTDSIYIISGSKDGEIKIWDLQTGSLLASLIAFKDNEWVAYTPDNYYICSPGGEKYVTFSVDNTIYDAPKYSKLYNNADVVASRLNINNAQKISTGKPKPVDKQSIDISTTPSTESAVTKNSAPISPPVVVINYFKCKGSVIEEENPVVESPEVEITATVKDNEHDLKKIIVTVNGFTYWEKSLSGKIHKLKQTITLPGTENRIKVIAINSMDIRGVEEKLITYQKTTTKASPLRDLVKSPNGKKGSWAVLIGIKDYSLQRNGMKPLPYALDDVQAVKDYLITGLDFDKDNIKTLVDTRATREEIIKELGENIPGRVGTNDRVLVYFSGHGGKEIIKTDEEEKTFSYLIPYDGKQKSLFSTGISMEVLSRLSERIRAKQVLFIIDACFSGNIGQIIKKSNVYTEETLKEIETFIKNKGREVLTAGTMDEEAVMGDKWNNHSVYTYYLLKGLRGGADYNGNKVITLTELQLYLETLVPKEAKQTPQRITLDSSRGGQFVFYWEGEE